MLFYNFTIDHHSACPRHDIEHVTLFCSRLHRGVIGSFARAIFLQDTPIVEIGQWLEPHGLLHQKLPGGHMATAFCYMLYSLLANSPLTHHQGTKFKRIQRINRLSANYL